MPELINTTDERIYWVITNNNNTIIHVGYTEPGERVSTGQPNIQQINTDIEQIEVLEGIVGNQPAFNYRFNSTTKTWDLQDFLLLPIRKEIADALSLSYFQIKDNDGTRKYCEVINHPDGVSDSLLRLDLYDLIQVEGVGNIGPIVKTLQYAVNRNDMSQVELGIIAQKIRDNAGDTITVNDFIPESWQGIILTEEKAIELGYEL